MTFSPNPALLTAQHSSSHSVPTSTSRVPALREAESQSLIDNDDIDLADYGHYFTSVTDNETTPKASASKLPSHVPAILKEAGSKR